MPVSFGQVWRNAGYDDGEDASVSNKNADLLGTVFDTIIDDQIQQGNRDGVSINNLLVERVQELAQGEPDIKALLAQGELEQEVVEGVEDGTISGVSGLLDNDSLGPLLIQAVANMAVYGQQVKISTEVNPTQALLSAKWLLEFLDVRLIQRSGHLDRAVVSYFLSQPW